MQTADASLLERTAQTMVRAGWSLTQGANEIRVHMLKAAFTEHAGNACRVAHALGHHRNTIGRLVEELKLGEFVRRCRADAVARRRQQAQITPRPNPARKPSRTASPFAGGKRIDQSRLDERIRPERAA